MCPNHTVDALVNSFVGDPQWESIIADDGNTYVNMMGEITVDLVPARMLLQFNVDGDEFGLQAIEVDGEAWTLFDGVAVLEKMCDEIGDY